MKDDDDSNSDYSLSYRFFATHPFLSQAFPLLLSSSMVSVLYSP